MIKYIFIIVYGLYYTATEINKAKLTEMILQLNIS